MDQAPRLYDWFEKLLGFGKSLGGEVGEFYVWVTPKFLGLFIWVVILVAVITILNKWIARTRTKKRQESELLSRAPARVRRAIYWVAAGYGAAAGVLMILMGFLALVLAMGSLRPQFIAVANRR